MFEENSEDDEEKILTKISTLAYYEYKREDLLENLKYEEREEIVDGEVKYPHKDFSKIFYNSEVVE